MRCLGSVPAYRPLLRSAFSRSASTRCRAGWALGRRKDLTLHVVQDPLALGRVRVRTEGRDQLHGIVRSTAEGLSDGHPSEIRANRQKPTDDTKPPLPYTSHVQSGRPAPNPYVRFRSGPNERRGASHQSASRRLERLPATAAATSGQASATRQSGHRNCLSRL